MQIENIPVDVEYIRLLYNVYSENISGYMFRGYTIVGSKISEKPSREIQEYSDAKRPIWFVFSGMGSQWAGMGTYWKFQYDVKIGESVCELNLKSNSRRSIDEVPHLRQGYPQM